MVLHSVSQATKDIYSIPKWATTFSKFYFMKYFKRFVIWYVKVLWLSNINIFFFFPLILWPLNITFKTPFNSLSIHNFFMLLHTQLMDFDLWFVELCFNGCCHSCHLRFLYVIQTLEKTNNRRTDYRQSIRHTYTIYT